MKDYKTRIKPHNRTFKQKYKKRFFYNYNEFKTFNNYLFSIFKRSKDNKKFKLTKKQLKNNTKRLSHRAFETRKVKI